MDVLAKLWNRLELLLAGILIALSLVHAGQTMGGMLTTSLSTDEFGTVGTFSSKGPVRVITDYRAPKNHIFFNLLNSVLPARDSLNPARVRALSILATMLTAGCIIGYAVFRRQLFEGGVLLALWSLAPEMVGLSMEARGYGFLALFAVVTAIATIEFFRTRASVCLTILAISTALGVYTVPGYLFFAGPLMVIVWLFDRTRRTFLFGMGTALAILILYLPVLGQLLTAFHDFQGDAEADYQTAHGILRALKLYLLPSDDWEGWLFLGAMAVAPLVLPVRENRIGRIATTTACVAFYAILLVLQSPPVRMGAFALLPLALVGILTIGSWIRSGPLPLRAVVVAGLGGLMIVSATKAVLWGRFQPAEDWSLAARAIDTAFPERVHVEFRRYAKYLKQTLADPKQRDADFDPASFAAGNLIVADASNKWAEGRQFVPLTGVPRLMEWTISGHIRDVVLTFALPKSVAPEGIPAAASDGNFETGIAIAPQDFKFSTRIPPDAKALVILLNRPVVHRDLLVQMTTGNEAGDLTGNVLLAGNGIVLPAADLAGKTIDVRLATLQPDLQVREVWISR